MNCTGRRIVVKACTSTKSRRASYNRTLYKSMHLQKQTYENTNNTNTQVQKHAQSKCSGWSPVGIRGHRCYESQEWNTLMPFGLIVLFTYGFGYVVV